MLALAFSPDGKQLVAGSHNGNVQFWDLKAGKSRRTCRSRATV